jgi:GT2 family glycosyltransferase
MLLTVLIPTWRRPESLARCLDALERQTRRPDGLVLCVRAGDRETRAMLAERALPFPLEIATPDAPGLLAALNAGFDRARGDVIATTDDDTAPHPDWLERIERRFEEDAELGGLGGRDRLVLQDGEPDAEVVVGRVYWFGRVVGNHQLGIGAMREVDLLKGANMALRRAALGERRIDTALRGPDTEHYTELDICLPLKREGWKLAYDPAIMVDHYEETRHGAERETLMSTAERRDAIFNQTYALLKHLPPVRRPIAFAYALLVGTRYDPGPLLAIERALLRRSSDVPSTGLRVTTGARLSALAAWWRWRRSEARERAPGRGRASAPHAMRR